GVSAADKKRMQDAFNVKTVNDLARLKFARWSQEICREAYNSMSAPIAQPTTLGDESSASAGAGQIGESGSQRWLRTLLLILLVAAILFALYWFFRNCKGDSGAQGKDVTFTGQPAVIEAPDASVAENPGAPASATETTGGDSRPRPVPDSRGGDATLSPKAGGELKPGANYPVQRGDTLYDLSRRAYGTQSQWRKIYEANRNLISDPDLLVTGRTLKIP
ncbi:MAG: LysM peptidoglycan-binding domain-containing protein, partial [Leptospirales bacterium]